ncbi:hypothetical protein, partial [Yersinia sp. 2542 StPb PI]|uniref:hypothetical protein n=1 Tax=Yersinia sp. 2542 StPb PI TaxID=3117408 RepID=UPI003B27E166
VNNSSVPSSILSIIVLIYQCDNDMFDDDLPVLPEISLTKDEIIMPYCDRYGILISIKMICCVTVS